MKFYRRGEFKTADVATTRCADETYGVPPASRPLVTNARGNAAAAADKEEPCGNRLHESDAEEAREEGFETASGDEGQNEWFEPTANSTNADLIARPGRHDA